MNENYENIILMESITRGRNLIVNIQKIRALGLSNACFLCYLEKQEEMKEEEKHDILNGWYESHGLELPDTSFIEELDKGWFELTTADITHELDINEKQVNRILNKLKDEKVIYIKTNGKRMIKLNHERIKEILVFGE